MAVLVDVRYLCTECGYSYSNGAEPLDDRDLGAETQRARYDRDGVPGGMTITIPEDFSTTDWPYDVAMSNDGHLLISKRPPWPVGVPYDHNASGKTWLT